MRVPIIMPQLGESIAEATIISIGIAEGDEVSADQEIIEVETNKALMQVTTPCAGKIGKVIAEAQQTYAVGTVLGYIDAGVEEAERMGTRPATPVPEASTNGHEPPPPARELPPLPDMPTDVAPPGNEPARPIVAGSGWAIPAGLAGANYLSPRLKARLAELHLQPADMAGVVGTGAGGRVSSQDLEKFVTTLEMGQHLPAPAMRIAVADAMRRSWTRPLATVGRPVALDPLLADRKTRGEPRPGVALYVLRALSLALAEDSAPATRLIGRRMVPPSAIDIGFAVEVGDGLMVPVIRGAAAMDFAGINARYHELVAAARRRQLPPEATGAAIATVTNFGILGLTWGTPIPLPEQNLMAGLGAGRKVPSWDEAKGAFVPVMEAGLTLTFDHRALDGAGAGRLLERMVQLLANPAAL